VQYFHVVSYVCNLPAMILSRLPFLCEWTLFKIFIKKWSLCNSIVYTNDRERNVFAGGIY